MKIPSAPFPVNDIDAPCMAAPASASTITPVALTSAFKFTESIGSSVSCVECFWTLISVATLDAFSILVEETICATSWLGFVDIAEDV